MVLELQVACWSRGARAPAHLDMPRLHRHPLRAAWVRDVHHVGVAQRQRRAVAGRQHLKLRVRRQVAVGDVVDDGPDRPAELVGRLCRGQVCQLRSAPSPCRCPVESRWAAREQAKPAQVTKTWSEMCPDWSAVDNKPGDHVAVEALGTSRP